jgi:hypothetical protein
MNRLTGLGPLTQSVHTKSQDRHTHSQAATLARDILEQENVEFRLDAAWKKGCAPFLIAWKNKIMDLKPLRDVGDPVTDHERQNPQMRAALGNLVSNKPPGVGTAAAPRQIPFNNLHEQMLSQAHTIDAALKMTDKETGHLHESERINLGRSEGQDPAGRGSGRGRGHGCGSGTACVPPEKWAAMTFDKRTEHHKKRRQAPDPRPHQRRRQMSLCKNNHSLTECLWMPWAF